MSNKVPQIRFKEFDDKWETNAISNISVINPKTEIPNSFEYVDLESVVGTTMVSHRTEEKKTAPSRAQRLAKKGDIFYQTVRPYQKNNLLFNLDEENYVFSTGYAQIRPYINGSFLFSALQSDKFVHEVLLNCTGTGYPAINSNDLGNLPVHYPTSNSEQSKIGSYFEQLDMLIEGKQKKLKKLKNLKKAYLDKMFPKKGAKVPEVRFKGFSGNWEEAKLGEIGKPYTGLTGKGKADFGHGDARYITYMNVFSNSVASKKMLDSIEIDSSQNDVKKGDLFFTVSSETPEEVGMSSVWVHEDANVYLNSFCFGFRPNIKCDSFYMAYLMRSSVERSQIILLAQGISRFNISKNKMMEITVLLPSLPEQQKIGSFFQSLGNLITLQQQELEKLKNIKSACLQKMFV